MKEQSDMPSWWRCDTHGPGTRTAWGCPECVRELRTSLATATRQLDEALALNAKWAEKAATWSASPEAAQRLQGYRDLAQQVAQAQNERDEARAELETERMRLTACGVVAMANTPESAARVRDILPKHFSASLHSVMGAVDREMELRAEVERLRSALRGLHDDIVEYQRINHLGGYDNHWMLAAREALAATEARPVNPDGLPTYDKEKALEWVAQLRDGNKEAKP